jgi:hypothetical protein
MAREAMPRGRKHGSTGAILVALAVAICCAAVFPCLAPARPLVTGIADPEATNLGDQLVFDRIHDAGGSFVRITVDWPRVAPADEPADWNPTDPLDPNYNWSEVDRQVVGATAAELEPLLQVYGAPTWAQGCQSSNTAYVAPCDPDPQAMAQFAKAAARRYSGDMGFPRARYFQVQNEPNLYLFFNPQFKQGRPVSPQLYRAIVNQFTLAVKSVHSSNLVVAGGLAPLQRPGGLGPMDFMRRLLCMRGREHPVKSCSATTSFDIWAMDPYTTGGPTHHAAGIDDVSLGDLPEMHRLLLAADRVGQIDSSFAQTPFWITEFSWDSKPPDPGGLPIRLHARWAAEALYRAWKAGVTTFLWFELRDQDPDGRPYSETVQSGLYFRGATVAQDKPKLTLRAFRFPFVAFRRHRGIAVWGRTPDSAPGQVRLSVETDSGWRLARSMRADSSGIFTGLIRTDYGSDGLGRVKAAYGTIESVPFSLQPVRDFYQPPFGRSTASGSRPRLAPPSPFAGRR